MCRKGSVYIHKASLSSYRERFWVVTDRHLQRYYISLFCLKIREEFTYLVTAHQTGVLQHWHSQFNRIIKVHRHSSSEKMLAVSSSCTASAACTSKERISAVVRRMWIVCHTDVFRWERTREMRDGEKVEAREVTEDDYYEVLLRRKLPLQSRCTLIPEEMLVVQAS